jgi:hypothetical protein
MDSVGQSVTKIVAATLVLAGPAIAYYRGAGRNRLLTIPKPATYLEEAASKGSEMSEEHDYKEYKIQITEYAGGWQAAIYPTKRGLPIIDWESKTIWSPNVMGALTLAKRHIDSTLAGS